MSASGVSSIICERGCLKDNYNSFFSMLTECTVNLHVQVNLHIKVLMCAQVNKETVNLP